MVRSVRSLVLAVLSIALLIAAVPSGEAGQALLPTPYPNAVPGAAPNNPAPTRIGGPQRLKRDPYPQILGDNAQGNPPIMRRRRHQRLVPSINQRKYRVDRVPRYYR